MSDKNRGMMPQSTAGLIRYFDEGKTAIQLKPIHIVGISVGLVAIELILKFGLFI